MAGSCGTVHSDSDYIIALSASQVDGGKHCGQKVQISNSAGKTIEATVADTVREAPLVQPAGQLTLTFHGPVPRVRVSINRSQRRSIQGARHTRPGRVAAHVALPLNRLHPSTVGVDRLTVSVHSALDER